MVVRRIGEPVQNDPDALAVLRRTGVRPGAVVTVRRSGSRVLVGSGGETAELGDAIGSHVFVAAGAALQDEVPVGAGLDEVGLAEVSDQVPAAGAPAS